MTPQTRERLGRAAVWAPRILLGLTFMLSGWAKCVDPWGFVYKIEEYLTIWGLISAIPRELTLVCAVGLSIFEFLTGLALATGSLRRGAPVAATAIMAVMLPLSAYIAIANPVSDCGCFGDLWVISNTATLTKNIVLTALAIYLLVANRRAKPLYRPALQWLVLAMGGVYVLVLAVVGWQLQPVVDFRPYPVGSELLADMPEDEEFYIYEKDGSSERFTLDALPDSTWTFVERIGGEAVENSRLALFDAEGEEVTEEVLDTGGRALIIITVPEPGLDYLSRARMANEINDYAREHDMDMIAAVASSGDALERWYNIARPHFPVYSASDTSLKELVRGFQGLVLVRDGRIVLKRNFSYVSPEILEEDDPFGSLLNPSDGRVAVWLTGALAAGLVFLWLTDRLFGFKERKNRGKGND